MPHRVVNHVRFARLIRIPAATSAPLTTVRLLDGSRTLTVRPRSPLASWSETGRAAEGRPRREPPRTSGRAADEHGLQLGDALLERRLGAGVRLRGAGGGETHSQSAQRGSDPRPQCVAPARRPSRIQQARPASRAPELVHEGRQDPASRRPDQDVRVRLHHRCTFTISSVAAERPRRVAHNRGEGLVGRTRMASEVDRPARSSPRAPAFAGVPRRGRRSRRRPWPARRSSQAPRSPRDQGVLLRAHDDTRRPVVDSGALPAVVVPSRSNTRFRRGKLLHRRLAANALVGYEVADGDDLVVEPAGVLGGRCAGMRAAAQAS